jgi:hypothetical protein
MYGRSQGPVLRIHDI